MLTVLEGNANFHTTVKAAVLEFYNIVPRPVPAYKNMLRMILYSSLV